MRGRAMLAAGAALLVLAVLATLFGVSGREPGAELSADGANCEGLPATIVGTDGNDTINGTEGVDVIVARGGNDVIKAYGGDDVICAGSGNDKITTGAGDDVALGGTGDDWVTSE